MKNFSNDDRISPAVDICKLLIERGAIVTTFDPMVTTEYEFKTKTQDEAIRMNRYYFNTNKAARDVF